MSCSAGMGYLFTEYFKILCSYLNLILGHIVCDHCVLNEDVTDCPQCREFMFCTNTLAGQLVSICMHACSFSYLGCPEGRAIDEIDEHERVCPERTIRCIFR